MAGKDTQGLFESALKAEGASGLLADLARSIYFQESGGGKNTATSHAGAIGGMQILPATFKSVADKGWDIHNPLDNARAGIRYLNQMLEKGGGDPRLAAVGYYGGPGAIVKAVKGVAVGDPKDTNAPNTFQYADQVLARMGLEGQAPAPGTPPVPTDPSELQAQMQQYQDEQTQAQAGLAEALQEMTAKAQAPIVQGPDPWQALMAQMEQSRKPVQPQGLNYGGIPLDDLGYNTPQAAGPQPLPQALRDWLS